MPVRKRPKEHQCEKCGKSFTSLMRLQHHRAAEHTAKTSRDIVTTRDIQHRSPGQPLILFRDKKA